MLVYESNVPVPDDGFIDLGAPADLGGRVLEGAPRISARFDFRTRSMTGGIFEATTGTVEITFPFTEHATILEGEATVTDRGGRTYTLRPGDSYFMPQGEIMVWKVEGPRVRKSFFNIVES